jgi:four helix bundle protein
LCVCFRRSLRQPKHKSWENNSYVLGTSVAANYRAVCRARSKAEFIARIGVVAEEADESILWLELLEETKILTANQLKDISQEAHALTAIFSASQKTARTNR